jgi:predicted ATPase/DNA-binding CsgD family transcriptional regulator
VSVATTQPEEFAIGVAAGHVTPNEDHAGQEWPVPLTSFVGRECELTEIDARLRNATTRLLTLTGPGGVGKTRLALRAGEMLRDAFADGVVLVDLSAIVEPAMVAGAIARALGLREGRSQASSWQELRDHELLLILDNFERVVSAAPHLADLLSHCPRIKALVTSRVVLHVTGEREFAVPPLGLPSGEPSLADAAASEAVALFLQRAQVVRGQFALTPENVDAVVEICRRLDGLPLAIELAAARTKVLAPTALLARLKHRLQVLTSGPQDQPTRLQTMRAAIAWSHDLLSHEEKTLFRRLAVFSGGFTLGAAEAASRELDVATPDYVFDVIASLVDKSLLRQEDGPDDEPRFAMLETIREFGLEELAASGEEEAVRARHADWCQEFVDEIWQQWVRRIDTDCLIKRLECDHDNLRAALLFLTQAGSDDGLLRLAGGLFWFWYIRGYLLEGRDWLVPAVAEVNAQATFARGRALLGAGTLSHYLGDEERAESLLQRALAAGRALNHAWLTTFTLLVLGIEEEHQANYELAKSLFGEAMAVARAANDPIALAQALSHRGLVGWATGEGDAAVALLHEALALQRQAGDTWGVGDTLDLLGLITVESGDWVQALTYVEESLTRRLAMGASKTTPWSLEIVALLAATTNRPDAAARLYGAATTQRTRMGSPQREPEQSTHLRAVARTRSALGEATFATVWAEGEALPLDESVAEARSVMASLRTAPSHSPATPPAIASTATNRYGLTEREIEVLRLVVEGLADREIADRLFISPRTAQKHVANIFLKLDVGSRTAAATAALRAGLVEPASESLV